MPVTGKVAINRRIYLNGIDFTGTSTSQTLSIGFEAADATVMGDTTKVSVPGLMTAEVSLAGYVTEGATGSDATLKTLSGTAVYCTLGTDTNASGETAYIIKGNGFSYNMPQALGEIPTYEFEVLPDQVEGVVRGTVLLDATSNLTASGVGTGRQLGAVASGESIYAMLQILSAGGTTFNAVIQSDDNAGFSSALTRASFSEVTTGSGSQYILPVAGPFTADYWRVSYTIVGSGPYKVHIVMGID